MSFQKRSNKKVENSQHQQNIFHNETETDITSSIPVDFTGANENTEDSELNRQSDNDKTPRSKLCTERLKKSQSHKVKETNTEPKRDYYMKVKSGHTETYEKV